MISEILAWFDSVGHGQQIDDFTTQTIHNWVLWLHGLSINQLLVLAISALVMLTLVASLTRAIYRRLIIVRRWYRRLFIPKNINLHLDREEHKSKN